MIIISKIILNSFFLNLCVKYFPPNSKKNSNLLCLPTKTLKLHICMPNGRRRRRRCLMEAQSENRETLIEESNEIQNEG